jgi:enamine deaminase RidA (YjgF/YER057c/UK114 family)
MKKTIQPDALFDSSQFGYSQVVATQGRQLVFIAGQVGWDIDGVVVADDLVAQAKQALSNVRLAIEAAGGTLADLTMMRTFIVDYRPEFVEQLLPLYLDLFADTEPPAQTWLGVQALALPDLKIEIEAQAVLD